MKWPNLPWKAEFLRRALRRRRPQPKDDPMERAATDPALHRIYGFAKTDAERHADDLIQSYRRAMFNV
jgi:hypothetical protein